MDRWLRTGLWWAPLVFAVFVAAVGAYAYRTLEAASRDSLRSGLETILEADVAALRFWSDSQKQVTKAAALDPEVRQAVAALAAIAHDAPPGELATRLGAAGEQALLRDVLEPNVRIHGFIEYAVIGLDGVVLSASTPARIGRRLPVDPQRLDKVLAGEVVITPPRRAAAAAEGPAPVAPPASVIRTGAPVPGPTGSPIAALGFALPADGGFTEVLRIARMGESGETYAFDGEGAMLSGSRFEDELVALGLLEEGQSSILQIHIRDPGGDMTQGFEPTLPVRARPLTLMAASAIEAEAGFDIDGYRDYRGVRVVGAWIWLPGPGLGIATELDYGEAYAGLSTVRRSFVIIAGALALAAFGMLGYSQLLGRMQRRYEKARRLGRYKVVEKIGEGGMGAVYRAQHALLRRPVAVKLLEADRATDEAVARFEREVQAAASLSHPCTIEIYDYGHTPDGAFYYAMEYIEGITCGQLVEADGAQPEARVLHLLRQASASLAEAHAADLIHRDLKPSNIMLCVRGGQPDFVKVLDFGLVRARQEDLQLTTTQSLTGTPLYLSPEALEAPESMDARSDVYQLGAIAYYLLAGRHVFQGETLVEILGKHLHGEPTPPSEVLGRAVSPDLEKLILRCLEKDRERRPADGAALLSLLEECQVEGSWTAADARAWWQHWAAEHPDALGEGGSGGSLPSGWQIDLGSRFGGSSFGGSGSRT